MRNVFDAVYCERSYRKAYDFDRSLEILHEMTETHFDPKLMAHFLPIAGEVRVNG